MFARPIIYFIPTVVSYCEKFPRHQQTSPMQHLQPKVVVTLYWTQQQMRKQKHWKTGFSLMLKPKYPVTWVSVFMCVLSIAVKPCTKNYIDRLDEPFLN